MVGITLTFEYRNKLTGRSKKFTNLDSIPKKKFDRNKWQLIYTHKVDLSTFPSRLGTMEVLYETHITKLFSPEIKVARLMKIIKQGLF